VIELNLDSNTFDEAQLSTDKGVRPDARPFDVIIIGGGSFGAALAQHVFNSDISEQLQTAREVD
jgi:hypothetical protein